MKSLSLTTRQKIISLLSKKDYNSRELASSLRIAESLIEDHLTHIIISVRRNPLQNFVMEIPECYDCQYKFQKRTRLNRPSRCPRCRSESISSPRFSISEIKNK